MNTPYYMTHQAANIPVIPLPNPGEGGPVGPVGPGNGVPVIPLPNPGEGGPVFPGTPDVPTIPLPNPGEGGPVGPDDGIPVIPLPNPGEGGPVDTGGNSIITIFPRPNIPCFFCSTARSGNVRFLNTANGYDPFLIYINRQLVVNGLGFAEASQYGKVSSGFQTVTVTSMSGYVYIQKPMMFQADSVSTIAIITTQSGLDLEQISDYPCATPMNTSCIRACNLSYNSGPLNVILNNGYVVFSNINYREVTPFSRVRPGGYQMYVTNAIMTPTAQARPETLVSLFVNVRANSIYTIYIFNWGSSPDSLRTMVIEDRK